MTQPTKIKSFLNLEGVIKSSKKPNLKKLRKEFERKIAQKRKNHRIHKFANVD